MRIFLDTEFDEDGRVINPLSIGLVREDGEEYYSEFASKVLLRPNKFVLENVVPNLKTWVPNEIDSTYGILAIDKGAKWPSQVREELLSICGNKPEFWGYFCDYDWVLICQLFGTMIDLPASEPYNWPMYCLDLKQEMFRTNWTKEMIEKYFPQPTTHISLDDARWVRDALSLMEGTK